MRRARYTRTLENSGSLDTVAAKSDLPGKEDTFVFDFENDREDIYEGFETFYEKTTSLKQSIRRELSSLAPPLAPVR